jgi:two-component flavin-dependent monooxygenase
MSARLRKRPRMLVHAERVKQVAAEHVIDGEADRCLSPAVADALASAGFGQHFAPSNEYAGDTRFKDMLLAQLMIAEVCISSAWCAANVATSGRMVGYFPEECQQEIWSSRENTMIANVLAPTGKAVRRNNDWLLSGRWRFASGVDFCAWSIVCAAVDGSDRSDFRFFLVPQEHYTVVDDWFNMGMRATGSKTITIDNVMVPGRRSFARRDLMDGRKDDPQDPSHCMPFLAYGPLLLAAPIVGAAKGALRWWVDWTREKADAGVRFRDKELNQLALAQSSAEIDAAELVLERVAAASDQGELSDYDAVRNARDLSFAAHLTVGAVDRLFRASGSQVQHETNPMQRVWRDVTSAVSHVGLRLTTSAGSYAKQVWSSS